MMNDDPEMFIFSINSFICGNCEKLVTSNKCGEFEHTCRGMIDSTVVNDEAKLLTQEKEEAK